MFCVLTVSSATSGDGEQELLQGLLTNDYCHVCEAILLFESQRIAHYEVGDYELA